MDGREFRKWVESGFQDYGRDPWFFTRELAQNSRDAGATAIQVDVKSTPQGEEILIFTDNGWGMSFDHACRYLFRLYASSKEQDTLAAGMYGVGFWTVLGYGPHHIIIESRARKNNQESWAAALDRELEVSRIPCRFNQFGTRITLVRQARCSSLEEFQAETRQALVRYCRYLRKRHRKVSPLPIFFLGENLNQPMRLPGPVSLSFHKGAVEGAVGLGEQPEVHLYARGLPVWRGTSLTELSHLWSAASPGDNCEIAHGLAPVFLLNGNNLDVNIWRQRAIDNRALQKVRKTAQAALTRLVHTYADQAFPAGPISRLTDTLKRTWYRFNRSFTRQLLLLLIIILPLEIVVLNKVFSTRKIQVLRDPQAIFYVDQNPYTGPTVGPGPGDTPVNMTYLPPVQTWFKIFTAERYDPRKGFVREPGRYLAPSHPAPRPCPGARISVQLHISRGGRIFLPQPLGYSIDPASVTLNRSPLGPPRVNARGEAVIHIPGKGGLVHYHCCPLKQDKKLAAAEISRLSRLPTGVKIPPGLEPVLAEYADLDIPQRVKKALELTASILGYDNSAETAARYRDSANRGDWFFRVRQIGSGDCDILNSVTVLFLRRMGVPARLVIGLTGDRGQILPGMHAWTEYFHQGWHVVDSSNTQAAAVAAAAGSKTDPPAPGAHGSEHVPVTPVPQPSSPSQQDQNSLLYFLITIAFFLLPLVLVIYRKNSREKNRCKGEQNRDQAAIRLVLGQMALGLLLRPGPWGRDSSIWHCRIIPTLNPAKKNISLQRVLKLAGAGKLFKGSAGNPLTRQYIDSGKLVLDKKDPAFRSLVSLVPGTVDLDRIYSLNAVPPGEIANSPAAQLLVKVNRVLKEIKMDCPACLWAPGLETQDFMDAALAHRPFIAVNPSSARLEMLSALFSRNPQLAAFNVIKAILQESRLFSLAPEIILHKSSRLLVEETP